MLLFFLLLTVFQSRAQPRKGHLETLTTEQWQSDLRSLYDSLQQYHLNLYHFHSRAVFDQRYKAIQHQIPRLAYHEIYLRLKQFVSLAGDGHTFLMEPDHYRNYPMGFFVFDNEVRLIRADEKYRHLLGLPLLSINGFPIKRIRDSLNTIIAKDESSVNRLKDQMFQLTTAEHLMAFQFVDDPDNTIFKFGAGNHQVTEKVAALPRSAPIAWRWAYEQTPLFLEVADTCRDALCHLALSPAAYYISFQGYADWVTMESKAQAIRRSLDSQQALTKVIIDMRLNGGGNYYKGLKVLLPMFLDYKALHPKVQFYVVIGRQTFSAGMSNAIHFRDCLNAIVVGEPSGAKPNGYQENRWFELPHTKLGASCSQLFYTFQASNTDGIIPTKRINPSFAAYKKGKDPVLSWILSRP